MAKDVTHYTLRTDPKLMKKLHYIASYNGRTTNKELEMLIKRYVAGFERKHGEIQPDDPDKQPGSTL